jgi:hypothetical protein
MKRRELNKLKEIAIVVPNVQLGNMAEKEAQAMQHADGAKNKLVKTLIKAGFEPGSDWFYDDETKAPSVIMDCPIPNGHIEFTVSLTGWGQVVDPSADFVIAKPKAALAQDNDAEEQNNIG